MLEQDEGLQNNQNIMLSYSKTKEKLILKENIFLIFFLNHDFWESEKRPKYRKSTSDFQNFTTDLKKIERE